MLKEAVNHSDQAYGQPLEVRHYGNLDGRFTLYEDDGRSFDYEDGKYRLRLNTVQENKLAPSTIGR